MALIQRHELTLIDDFGVQYVARFAGEAFQDQ
jgi:hypothetical protein